MKAASSATIHWSVAVLSGAFLGATQQLPGLSALAAVALVPLVLTCRDRAGSLRAGLIRVLIFLLAYCTVEVLWMYRFGMGKVLGIGVISAVLLFLFLLPAILGGRRHTRQWISDGALITGWVAFETFTQTWSLSYPLMSLGTSLVEYEGVFGWYALTGTTGGTVLVLLVGQLLATLTGTRSLAGARGPGLRLAGLLAGLFVFTLLPYATERGREVYAAVLHPNLDVRTERQELDDLQTAERYADQIREVLEAGPHTSLIVAPENALMSIGWQDEVAGGIKSPPIEVLQSALTRPAVRLLIGGFVYQEVGSVSAYPHVKVTGGGQTKYVTYNTITELSPTDFSFLHAKDRLVPFEEFVPRNGLLAGLVPRVGATGFYLTSGRRLNDRRTRSGGNTDVLPLICYESLFSFETAARLRARPAELIAIHLNEGWYDTDYGSRKFLLHGMARALETGKYVLRSSNRGDSSIISDTGELLANTHTREQATYLAGPVRQRTGTTPYVEYTSIFLFYTIWLAYAGTIVYFLGAALLRR